MVNPVMIVLWSNRAKKQLKDAYEYILRDSFQNAVKVRDDIISATNALPENPFKYPPDKYKFNNDDSYRAFEKHRYRIACRALEKEIRSPHLPYQDRTFDILNLCFYILNF